MPSRDRVIPAFTQRQLDPETLQKILLQMERLLEAIQQGDAETRTTARQQIKALFDEL